MMSTILLLVSSLVAAGDWSQPGEVRHEDALVVSYTARVDGPYLVVRAEIAPGWHTFSLDNVHQVQEKLAGKPALSMDKSTEIIATGLTVEGPWRQSAPKDFSRPELRMYSFGYDHEGVFAAKVRAAGVPSAKLRVRGQACTDAICKNVDVSLTVAVPPKLGAVGGVNFKELVPAR